MQITATQLEQVNKQIQALVSAESFYGKKLEDAGISGVASPEDFTKLPFSEKNDLREAYPLGLMTAPEEEIVRIHSSSGTTGLPVIIPYTAKDVEDWVVMKWQGLRIWTEFRSPPGMDSGQPESAFKTALKNSALWSFLWAPETQTNSFK